ncbi:alpha-ribazole phosphatase [candidate division KSB3 bacterium]|uniref:Alpha-ribazole phosphatase n=1 Tax=candidate division KSB3 bacterium TaxID=2044937 RepID=A0A9D5JZL3_9BACT|nr:alpha-ribazole phosphatase [candidate division KSB3 bacterium]MBD3326696.1 alpha-ribazole phosphatase [candidate division KSB3 bacterium]
MTTTILLIRHGETAWNRGKIFRGVYDIPLNENGRSQAGYAARVLASRPLEAAYSSPLSRAMETARIVLEPHNIEPIVHAGLKDCNYGQWTGLEEAEVARRWPQEHARWGTAPHTARPPDGDTLQEVFDRAFDALEGIARQHDGQTVAVFAHRVVNKLLVLGMLTLGLERFPFLRQDNCCVNEFQRTEQGYIAVTINDTSHLRQAGVDLLNADF